MDSAILTSSMSCQQVPYQAAENAHADLKVTSREQDLKTRNGKAIESCLTPAAGHQFDLLVASVFHQLCVNGWHASALSTLFPTGVPAITGSQQASPLGLAVMHLNRASSGSINSANQHQQLAQTSKHASTTVSSYHESQLCMAQSSSVRAHHYHLVELVLCLSENSFGCSHNKNDTCISRL